MAEYIEREAAINTFYTATADGDKADWCVGVIQSLPAASVRENVTGEWIGDNRYFGFPNWHCSRCKGEGRGDYFFCPWCGADMRGGNDG